MDQLRFIYKIHFLIFLYFKLLFSISFSFLGVTIFFSLILFIVGEIRRSDKKKERERIF